ncbi:adaptor protein [Theileria orientalis]|uniref:Adaptor protein n=1 Tax=Theileria orientalis TaxID=68886 RepID=A0A976QQI8_THEOR|nr:adaptor protein [Theileria orientalis]
MISCLFITNSSGKILALRIFRGDVTKEDAQIFCRNVIFDNNHAPTYRYEKLNFFRVNMDGLNLVALTRRNGNSFLIFHTLNELKKILYTFLSGVVNEENIINNSFVVYELFDEAIDGGYTQNLESLVLTDFMATKVQFSNILSDSTKLNANKLGYLSKFGVDPESYIVNVEPLEGKLNESDECLEYNINFSTLMATSVIPPWRKVNNYTGRNVINVDLVENINIMYSYNSELIYYEIRGSLIVNTQLPGMPVVHLRMNDNFNVLSAASNKYINDLGDPYSKSVFGGLGRKNYQTNSNSSEFQLPVAAKQAVRLDDYKFHQCVDLNSIKNNKTITFIPPDGMFVLLCYRSTSSATIPFIVRPKVKMIDSLHINYSISLTPTFSKSIVAQKVFMKIPIPVDTKEVVAGAMSSGTGLDVNLSHHLVNWTFKKLHGEVTYFVSFTAILATNKVVQSTNFLPSVKLQFNIPWFTSSGLYIASIECTNVKGKVNKNVNYITKAGLYEHRIRFM